MIANKQSMNLNLVKLFSTKATICLMLCGQSFGEVGLAVQSLKEAPVGAGKMFTALDEKASGVSFVNPIDKEHPLSLIHI